MILLKRINKIYGEGDSSVHALKDVDLVIEDGRFTAITGKSGSGKSTLMNLIGALDTPTSGELRYDDTLLSDMTQKDLAKFRNRNTGFVFQSFFLEPTFSVLENVCMPLTIAGVSKEERCARATDLLKKLGLEDKIFKKANELSGGQKQRVSIARALIHKPKILLADEPTGNLDSQNGREVMKLLREIASEGTAVVLVTHNEEDAKNADRRVEIADGVVTASYMPEYLDLFRERSDDPSPKDGARSEPLTT